MTPTQPPPSRPGFNPGLDTSPALGPLAGEGTSGFGRVKPSAYILAIFAALFLTAWAPRPAHHAIKSIGVIAAVGDTAMFAHVHDQPFEWIAPPEAGFLEIADWAIDDEVVKAIAAALGPGINVQSIPVEHQDFDTWSDESLTRRIRELPLPESPVDAYLLVLRDWRPDAIGGSDHQLAGLGLYRRDVAHGRTRYGVFASYRLVLMEPDRGRVIASRAAILPNGRLPWVPAAQKLWPQDRNDLTQSQRDTLRADFLKLIAGSLPATLRQLGFAVK